MPDTGLQTVASGGSALSSEHYRTFEMAKENDSVLGGDNIAQIRSYAAYARAQAQAIHKTIAATTGIEDVAAIKQEALETEQTFARVGLYADTRIGELLRELPKATAGRKSNSVPTGTEFTKRQAEQAAGIAHKQSIDLQALAANPDVVQAVLDKAEAEGRVASRAQVLRAIKERDEALDELEDAYQASELMEAEVASLRKQLSDKPASEVVEREVVREVSSSADRRRIQELEHLERLHEEDNQKLRKQLADAKQELDRAKGIIGMNQSTQDIRSDVQYLISATNAYVRRYGGLTWTFQQLEEVDEPTLDELKKAVTNLATFSNALVSSMERFNGK